MKIKSKRLLLILLILSFSLIVGVTDRKEPRIGAKVERDEFERMDDHVRVTQADRLDNTSANSLKASAKSTGEWWDSNYQHREKVTIAAETSNVPSGYTQYLEFDHASLVSASKSQADGDDIMIVYWNGSSWTELDRILDPTYYGKGWNDNDTRILFKIQAQINAGEIDDNYYIYYGYSTAINPPASESNVWRYYNPCDNTTGWTTWGDTQTFTATGGRIEFGDDVVGTVDSPGQGAVDGSAPDLQDVQVLADIEVADSANFSGSRAGVLYRVVPSNGAYEGYCSRIKPGGDDYRIGWVDNLGGWGAEYVQETMVSTFNVNYRFKIRILGTGTGTSIKWQFRTMTGSYVSEQSYDITGGDTLISEGKFGCWAEKAGEEYIDNIRVRLALSDEPPNPTLGSEEKSELRLLRIFDNAIYNAWHTDVSTYECTLSVVATDPEASNLKYVIQWDKDPNFGGASSKTIGPYTAGEEAETTIPLGSTAEDAETLFYWKAYAETAAVGVEGWYNSNWQYREKITIDHTKVEVGGEDWYNSNWQYRNKITIDHTKVPNTDQSYFPVLINSTYTDWKVTGSGGHVGQLDGGDILFTSSDGTTKLDHEIEKYDQTTGELVAWVEVPAVSNATDTDIYIYYGNATAVDQWNVSETWDEGGDSNYVAVWHLNESSDAHSDATGNGYNSTAITVTQQGADIGRIDGADDFDGDDDYVTFGDLLNFASTNFTIEIWFKAATIDTLDQNTFISKWGSVSENRDFRFEIDGPGSDNINFAIYDVTNGYKQLSGGSPLTPGNWYYAAVTIDWAEDDAYLYLNGGVDDSEVNTWTWARVDGASEVAIGKRIDDSPYQWFDGIIDEVRISTTARSADWIATCYNNQDSPSTFYSVGTIEEQTLNNFPVLIDTTDTDWKVTGSGGHVGQLDGGDILFTSSDGTTKLDHEIEKYDQTTGELVAWVEVPAVSNATDTDIYIYYGNATAVDQWNVSETWDEGGDSNYVAVWHLNESSDAHSDATGNGYNSTAITVTQQGADIGRIDGADSLDGVDDYVRFPDPLDFSSTNFTIEIWFNATTIDASDEANQFISKWHTDKTSREFRLYTNYSKLDFDILNGETYHSLSDPDSLVAEEWYYAAVTVDWAGTPDAYLYHNGVEIDKDESTWPSTMNTDTSSVILGMEFKGAASRFPVDGIIDEVRISTTDRSADWIKTCYNNQSSPSTFYGVATEEEVELEWVQSTPWSETRSFTMDMELAEEPEINSPPYWYQVHRAQFEQCTKDNVEVVGDEVKLVSEQTSGTLTSPPIVYSDLKTEGSGRNDWDGVKWTKSTKDDDIKLMIEYKSGGTWSLVPDEDLPNNSTGLSDMDNAFCTVDLSSLSTSTYNTLRIKAIFTKGSKSADDPTLEMWALGKEGGITYVSPINKPLVFALSRNKPNPFIGKTEIQYQLPKRTTVNLQVFDILGRSVVTLLDKVQKPGHYSIQWRGTDKNNSPLPTGVYFLLMKADEFKATQKMVLLR